MSKGEYQQATMDDDETTYILDGRKTHRAKPQRPYLAFIAGSAVSHTVGTWPERYPRRLACLSRAIMRTRHTRSCSAAGMAVATLGFPFIQPYLAKHFGGKAIGAEPPSPSEVVASHRSDMLSRPLKNIIECKPGQQCRLGADNRFKVLGQKGAAGMVKTGCAATAWRR